MVALCEIVVEIVFGQFLVEVEAVMAGVNTSGNVLFIDFIEEMVI